MKRIMMIALIFQLMVLGVLFSQEYKLSDKDINEFLSFADEYKAMAAKFIKIDETKGISGIFYNDNKKLLTATTNFLKKKKWTYDQFNQFIYKVTVTLVAYKYYEEYGYPEEVGDSEDNEAFKDVTPEDLELVKKFQEKLAALFPESDNPELSLDESSDAMN